MKNIKFLLVSLLVFSTCLYANSIEIPISGEVELEAYTIHKLQGNYYQFFNAEVDEDMRGIVKHVKKNVEVEGVYSGQSLVRLKQKGGSTREDGKQYYFDIIVPTIVRYIQHRKGKLDKQKKAGFISAYFTTEEALRASDAERELDVDFSVKNIRHLKRKLRKRAAETESSGINLSVHRSILKKKKKKSKNAKFKLDIKIPEENIFGRFKLNLDMLNADWNLDETE